MRNYNVSIRNIMDVVDDEYKANNEQEAIIMAIKNLLKTAEVEVYECDDDEIKVINIGHNIILNILA